MTDQLQVLHCLLPHHAGHVSTGEVATLGFQRPHPCVKNLCGPTCGHNVESSSSQTPMKPDSSGLRSQSISTRWEKPEDDQTLLLLSPGEDSLH